MNINGLIKNSVVTVSVLGSLLAYLMFEANIVEICDIYCSEATGHYHRTFIFFYFLLFFSLITYFAPEKVFQNWWRFARIAVPVVLILAFIINLELHHNPNGQMQNMFDAPALGMLYLIFTIGSVVQIIRGYRQKLCI